MDKVLMRALRKTYYAGRFHALGEEFEVQPQHVRLLTAVRSAEVIESPKPKKGEYKRRDMRAEH